MKRGQITTFAIIGIIIVAAILLVLYLRGQLNIPILGLGTAQERLNDIKEHITGCIEDISEEPLRKIGLQGGHLATPEGTYRKRNDITISYLCYNIPDQSICSNSLLLLNNMEKELAQAIDQGLNNCINLESFRRGYDMTTGKRVTTVTIGKKNKTIIINLPVTLRDGETEVKENEFTALFNYPLGALYHVSQDIVNTEASLGEFEQLSYMLSKRGKYEIQKDKPYPDKLYTLHATNNDYTFQFFIQGEPN